jgi:hypothetical protein
MRAALSLTALVLFSACNAEPGTGHRLSEPNVTLLSPVAGAALVRGTPFQFVAEADTGSSLYTNEDFRVIWSSSVDGRLDGDLLVEEDGLRLNHDGWLTPGAHTFTVRVVLEDGAEAQDKVRLTVAENTAPTIELVFPTAELLVPTEDGLDVQAVVADVDEDPDALTVDWLLDGVVLDGPDADRAGLVRWTLDELSAGVRTLQLVVTDSGGLVASTEVEVELVVSDVDGDGHRRAPFGDDCDDFDASIHPGAHEVCDGVDNDCDTYVDDEDGGVLYGADDRYYLDVDTDGFGDPGTEIQACLAPGPAWIQLAGDCDDANDAIHPAADEVCDPGGLIDEDCTGVVDDDDFWVVGPFVDVWPDVDGDGFGERGVASTPVCHPEPGWVPDRSDCDDDNDAIHPDGSEVCNGYDDDCDGLVDDLDDSLDATDAEWSGLVDGDADGFGAHRDGVCSEAVLVVDGGDCDDLDRLINPDALEVCGNGIDDDCSGDDAGCLILAGSPLEGAGAFVPFLSSFEGEVGDRLGEGLALSEGELLIGAPGNGGSNVGMAALWHSGWRAATHMGHGGAAVRFWGLDDHDEAGRGVAIGDLNGDGIADYAVGAPGWAGTGGVFLFDGAMLLAGGATDVFLDEADREVLGVEGGWNAGDQILVGDVNCDGQADLVVGAPGNTSNDDGQVAVFYGGPGLLAGSPLDFEMSDILIEDEGADGKLGTSLAMAGDTTGLGCSDLLVGADSWGDSSNRGAAHLFLHGEFRDALPGALLEPSVHAVRSYLGVVKGRASLGMAGVGDLDGDGKGDLAIGAPHSKEDSGEYSGRVWFITDHGAGPADLEDGVFAAVTGEERRAYLGQRIANVGDISGDGIDDLVISEGEADGDEDNTGRLNVLYGPVGVPSGPISGVRDGWVWAEQGAMLGNHAVVGGADVDGDGYGDFAASASSLKREGHKTGKVYVFFGSGS